MKNTLKTFAFSLILAILCTVQSFGQTALGSTTLTSAVLTPNVTTINLPTTGMLNAGPANQINTVLYANRELMRVITVVDSTHVTVQRGQNQTRPFVHASGTKVYYGPPTGNFFANSPDAAESWGSCLNSNEVSLPKIYVTTGDIFQCYQTGAAGTSGQWIRIGHGTMSPAGSRVSAFCTGTAGSAETEYLNGAACSGATTLTARQIISTGGTLANLYVVSSAAFTGGTNKDVITVYKNGSATAITCTAAATATTCSDTTHSVAVVPGDIIAFQFVSATSDTAANVSAVVGVY